jgi:AcrR family transcriptional regulator
MTKKFLWSYGFRRRALPKGFTEHEKELIRKRLLKEGYRQFSTYGLKKTNIEELAKAAKISKGAFYLFYESKEALFMDVAEVAEQRYRQELLATIDLPGPSPRARLQAVFKKAFALLKTIPVLQFFTGSDFDLLFRKIPAEKLQEHLASDQMFFGELVTQCQNAGIPIRVQPEEISRLLYPLVLASLHEDDLNLDNFNGSIDLLLELIAAFCLGEVEIQNAADGSPT